MPKLTTIQFNNQTLLTVKKDNTIYTVIKPICENIGLAWHAQFERIKRDEVLNSTIRVIRTVAEDGKNREQICLPINYLNGWLFGVNVKRVKPEIQDTLIMYKKECYQVLNDYWNKGIAINPRLSTKDERLPLRNAVNTLSAKTGIHWKTIWDMVNDYMATKHVDEISIEDLPKAIEYVHGLIVNAEQPNNNAQVLIKALVVHTFKISNWFEDIRPALGVIAPDTTQKVQCHFYEAKVNAWRVNSEMHLDVDREITIKPINWGLGNKEQFLTFKI